MSEFELFSGRNEWCETKHLRRPVVKIRIYPPKEIIEAGNLLNKIKKLDLFQEYWRLCEIDCRKCLVSRYKCSQINTFSGEATVYPQPGETFEKILESSLCQPKKVECFSE